jgi:hypothetical protein
MVCCEVSILVRAGHSAVYFSLFTRWSRSVGLEFLYRLFSMPLVYPIQLCTILSLYFFSFFFIPEAIDLVGYDLVLLSNKNKQGVGIRPPHFLHLVSQYDIWG